MAELDAVIPLKNSKHAYQRIFQDLIRSSTEIQVYDVYSKNFESIAVSKIINFVVVEVNFRRISIFVETEAGLYLRF